MIKNVKTRLISCLCLIVALASGCSKEVMNEDQKLNLGHVKKASNGDGSFDVLGYAYDVTGKFLHHESLSDVPIIDVKKFRDALPQYLDSGYVSYGSSHTVSGLSAIDYQKEISKQRFKGLKGNVGDTTFLNANFKKNKEDNAVDKFYSRYSYASHDEVRHYRRLRFVNTVTLPMLIPYLTPEFVANTNNMSADQIVQTYGTHVLIDITLGGRMTLLYSASVRNQTSTTTKKRTTEGGLGLGMLKVFGIDYNNGKTTSEMTQITNNSENRDFFLEYSGGSNSGYSFSLDKDGNTSQSFNIGAWIASINDQNSEITEINNAFMISDFIADPTKKELVRQAIYKYIKDRQVPEAGEVPVYGYYNATIHNHLYTANPDEYPYEQDGYVRSGVTWYAFPKQVEGTLPVYSYYHPQGRNHTYTINRDAYNHEQNGYTLTGIPFYAYPSQVPGSSPIHVFYDPGRGGNHVYTIDRYNYPYEQNGYSYLGVNFYALP